MRLGDLDALKEKLNKKALDLANGGMIFIESINHIIDNAPTVEEMPRICQVPSIYHEPMKNNYKKAINNGSQMLECPKCFSRINANAFTYAVGNAGYAFCPYCGADLRGEEE